jgi:hypothetical protein
VACFPLHFHFCLSPYETQYPIKATRLDPLEQNKMGNSCTAILITLTALVMVPGLTAGTWTREAVPFIYLFGSDTRGDERTNVWSYDRVSIPGPRIPSGASRRLLLRPTGPSEMMLV